MPEHKKHIAFSGHRDRQLYNLDLLKIINEMIPNYVWVHGGAFGFDLQVEIFARKENLERVIVRPDYKSFGGHRAPLQRNEKIVDMADIVFIFWDGRTSGGTYHTYKYAVKNHVPAINLYGITPDELRKQIEQKFRQQGDTNEYS